MISGVGPMSQRDRIVALLREHRTLCSWDLAYRSYMPHASSRIAELNDEGWIIRGTTQKWGGEVNGNGEELPGHAHYTLVQEAPAKQMRLAVSA